MIIKTNNDSDSVGKLFYIANDLQIIFDKFSADIANNNKSKEIIEVILLGAISYFFEKNNIKYDTFKLVLAIEDIAKTLKKK